MLVFVKNMKTLFFPENGMAGKLNKNFKDL